LSHGINLSTDSSKLNLTLNGNLTINSGGKVDVSGKGFGWSYDAQNWGPGYGGDYDGGTHGGRGGDRNANGIAANTYGSIKQPVTMGSMGYLLSYGGGAAKLVVGGTLTVNGLISADGWGTCCGAGSGGSVYITAGALSGNGPISANGANKNSTYAAGGGGRVAAYLTDSAYSFTTYLGTMSAYGGNDSEYAKHGAAGTVYRQLSNGNNELIIDNFGRIPVSTSVVTDISMSVSDADVSTVTIKNGAILDITASTFNFVVRGDWINLATSSLTGQKLTNGTVAFVNSSNAQYVRSNMQNFYNLVSSNTSAGGLIFTSSLTARSLTVNSSALGASATVYFAGQSTFTISTFTMTGSGSNLVVLKSTASSQWYVTVTSHTVSGVQVSSSNASYGQTIYASNSSGNNTTNWVFPSDTGVRYWVATGTSSWSSASNWSTASGGPASGGVPTSTHTVIFDANSKGNALMYSSVSVATITISGSTATIKTQSYDLTLSSGFSQSSGRVELGTSIVTMSGTNWAISGGAFDAGTSTVQFKFNSTTNTILSNGTSFYHLVFTTATATTVGVLKPVDGLYVLGNMTLDKGIFNNQLSSASVKVTGNVLMRNDQTNMGASTWTVSGNFDVNSIGQFAHNSSTLVMDGTGKSMNNSQYTDLGNFNVTGTITGVGNNTPDVEGNLTVGPGAVLTINNMLRFTKSGGSTVSGSGSITGAGQMQFPFGSTWTGFSGSIDVTSLAMWGDSTMAAITYASPNVFLYHSGFGGTRYVTFAAGNTTFNGDVTINNTVSGQPLNVINSSNNPNLIFRKNLTVTEAGGVVIWSRGTGSIYFSTNATAQTVSFIGKSVDNIISSNTSSGGLTFSSSFTAAALSINAATLSSAATIYFAGASTFTISTFTITGSASYPVVLKSTNSSVDWRLNNTSQNSVTYAQVNRSSASAGITIMAPNSTDLGNNTNWVFVGTTNTWTGGGADSNCSTAGNWSLGRKPTVGDVILLDGTSNKAITWDASCSTAVYSWTQTMAATNTVTFNTTFGTSFSTFTVAANVQLSSGIWTHADNSSAETYWLCTGRKPSTLVHDY
jgi:hypothetical protein